MYSVNPRTIIEICWDQRRVDFRQWSHGGQPEVMFDGGAKRLTWASPPVFLSTTD